MMLIDGHACMAWQYASTTRCTVIAGHAAREEYFRFSIHQHAAKVLHSSSEVNDAVLDPKAVKREW